MYLRIYTDGGSRGNPGPAAVGFVIKKIDVAKREETELYRGGQTIGVATNNVAEYTAVLEALKWLCRKQKENPDKETKKIIEFRLDSRLAASQLSGIFKVKDPKLRELLVTIYNLVGELKAIVSYHYIPREENQEADFEVNLALNNLVK
ncbi:ribonuclease HI family protein [Candidatus Gottesmanbacteria bacterium]|nr:ribonuclease HI family protein [Candidatus Gottesmanbacteria bacterium]